MCNGKRVCRDEVCAMGRGCVEMRCVQWEEGCVEIRCVESER